MECRVLSQKGCHSAPQKRLYQPSDDAHVLDEVHLNLLDNCINKSPDNLLVRSAEAGMPSRDSPACEQAPSRGTSHLSQAVYSLTSVASPWLRARRICRITACYRDQSDPLTCLTASFNHHLSHNLF